MYYLLLFFVLTVFIGEYIIPLPSYYIKAKDEVYMENIIMNEMDKANISYESNDFKIINYFLGKNNQLYLCQYEHDGMVEARMFHFKRNVFGHLKPAYDFSKNSPIKKGDEDTRYASQLVSEGLSRFHITYGYRGESEEPLNTNLVLGKFMTNALYPEGFYMLPERDHSPMDPYSWLRLIIFLIVIAISFLRERKLILHTEIIIPGKRVNVLKIIYYKENKFV